MKILNWISNIEQKTENKITKITIFLISSFLSYATIFPLLSGFFGLTATSMSTYYFITLLLYYFITLTLFNSYLKFSYKLIYRYKKLKLKFFNKLSIILFPQSLIVGLLSLILLFISVYYLYLDSITLEYLVDYEDIIKVLYLKFIPILILLWLSSTFILFTYYLYRFEGVNLIFSFIFILFSILSYFMIIGIVSICVLLIYYLAFILRIIFPKTVG